MSEQEPRKPDGRTIEPLPPPPGRFDLVYRESRRRRYNRAVAVCGVAGVFLAGLFGGLALSGPRNAVVTAIEAATTKVGDVVSPPSPSPGAEVQTSTEASKAPKETKRGSHQSTTAAASVTAPPPQQTGDQLVNGRVLDKATGEPVKNLYVYAGTLSELGFVPTSTVARTDAAGRYRVACTGGPVLITSWPLNVQRGATVLGDYAARLIDAPRCGQDRPLVTHVKPGAVLVGDISSDKSCTGEELRVWLWVLGSRAATVRLGGLYDGGSYRISGLPSGTSVFGDHGTKTPVALTAGETERQDLTLACQGESQTNEPTATVEPTPTPTDAPSSSPSPTDPQPSTSTPTGSGSTSSAPTPR